MRDPAAQWQLLRRQAEDQHGVFTTADAVSFGLSPKRLRRAAAEGHVSCIARGVYAFVGSTPTDRQLMMAASLLDGMASHGSAAHLHRLDGFAQLDRVDVSFARGRQIHIRGATVHTWRYDDPNDITAVEGIRCTSLARTLVQLGAAFDRETVEIALDSAIRRGVKLDWIRGTAERLNRPGVTGVGTLMDILRDENRVTGVESPLEQRLAKVLIAAGLPRPIPQFEIRTPDGVFRADLAYPEHRLLIEAHSMQFHPGPRRDRDMRRHLALTAAGYEIIYVTAAMLEDPASFLPQVWSTLGRRTGRT